MNKCNEQGSYKGQCCCNCLYQAKVVGHPWNQIYKRDNINHACTIFHTHHQIHGDKGWQTPNEIGIIVLHEFEHGMCECWISREENIK